MKAAAAFVTTIYKNFASFFLFSTSSSALLCLPHSSNVSKSSLEGNDDVLLFFSQKVLEQCGCGLSS